MLLLEIKLLIDCFKKALVFFKKDPLTVFYSKTAFQENVVSIRTQRAKFTLFIYILHFIVENSSTYAGRKYGIYVPKKCICRRTKLFSIEIKHIMKIKSELTPCALPLPLAYSGIDCRAVPHSVLK